MDSLIIDKTALAIIQDASNSKPKSRPKTYFKISMLPLHNTAMLETWKRRFDFISEKIIK